MPTVWWGGPDDLATARWGRGTEGLAREGDEGAGFLRRSSLIGAGGTCCGRQEGGPGATQAGGQHSTGCHGCNTRAREQNA